MGEHLAVRRFPVLPGALGLGGDGPWEDRVDLIRAEHPNDAVVGGYLNAEHSVQLYQHPELPGIDHLIVRRHDGQHRHPGWAALQAIKDAIAPNGPERFAVEVFPPTDLVIDNHPLWHLWVMQQGWEPGFGLHSAQAGGVRV